MSNKKPLKIAEPFSCLNDPRGSNRRHKLIDIITIAICAVICGCDGYDHIEEFGKAKYEWFKKFLDLPHGIPSHDTFERVFAALDPKEFQRAFISWVEGVSKRISGEFVHIDGKTVCGSYDKNSDKSAIHIVSAWAANNGLVLGQLKTEEKSNEITAIPELIKLLELEGCLASIDAMGCQTKIAEVITEEGADYVLALKGNQKTLHEETKMFFEEAEKFNFEGVDYDFHEETDGGHGRVEVRRCWTSSDTEWLKSKESWSGLRTMAIVWTPKYRFQILKGDIKRVVQNSIRLFCKKLSCEIIELNIQQDHVHHLVMVPPKVSISSLMGTLKGKSAIRFSTTFLI